MDRSFPNSHSLLLRKFSQIISLDSDDIDCIENYFELRTFQKNHTLVDYGHKTKYLYFINHGYIRLIRNLENKEITRYIAGPNSFLTAFPSFLYEKSSEEKLLSITKVELLRITYKDLREFSKRKISYSQILNRLYEETIVQMEERATFHLTRTASERYSDLYLQFPGYFDSIPDKILASYLGMEPETFSKIKASRKKSGGID
ncbi:MAG: Crp/Fnr family transcriptional regulator [Leptospira sp.]|nr:Crp/Fnr family transcriptional regulator [Leptospira sp.]